MIDLLAVLWLGSTGAAVFTGGRNVWRAELALRRIRNAEENGSILALASARRRRNVFTFLAAVAAFGLIPVTLMVDDAQTRMALRMVLAMMLGIFLSLHNIIVDVDDTRIAWKVREELEAAK